MRKTIIPLALLFILLTGCNVDSDFQTKMPDRIPISITAVTESMNDTIATRAGTNENTAFVNGDAINVTIVDGNNNTSQHTYSYNGSTWSGNAYYPAGDVSVVVSAYAPQNAAETFSVESDQSGSANYKKSDLLYADGVLKSKPTSESDRTIPLTFTHKMAKIIINTTSQTSGLTIKKVTLQYVNRTINRTTACNTSKGSVASLTAVATNSSNTQVVVSSNSSGASTLNGAALIPPQNIAKGKGFVFVETNQGNVTYSIDDTGGKNFCSGNSYTLNLNVSQIDIGLTVSITGWSTNTGTVTVNPSTITKGFVNATLSQYAYDYNGSSQKPTVTVKDGNTVLSENTHYTLGWPSNTTDAGTKTVTVSGINSAGYTGSIGLNYVINKIAGSSSISNNILYIQVGGSTKTISVTRLGNGSISTTSSNSSIAYGSGVSGTTVTIKTGSSTGTATITVKVAAGTNHLAPSNKTLTVVSVPQGKAITTGTTSDIGKLVCTSDHIHDTYRESIQCGASVKGILTNAADGDYTVMSLYEENGPYSDWRYSSYQASGDPSYDGYADKADWDAVIRNFGSINNFNERIRELGGRTVGGEYWAYNRYTILVYNTYTETSAYQWNESEEYALRGVWYH